MAGLTARKRLVGARGDVGLRWQGAGRKANAPSHPHVRGPRRKHVRLVLEELEPRVAPSSLLHNLPFFGPILDSPARPMGDDSWAMVDEEDTVNHQPLTINHPVCSPAPGLSADFSPVAPSEFHRPEVAIERDPPGTLADDALGGVLPTVPVDAEPEHDSLDPLIRIFATEDDGRIPEHTQSAESAPEYASAIRWVAFPSSEESLASPLLPLAHADDGPTAENTGDPETQEVAFIPSRVVISDAPGISSETPWPSEGLKAPLAKLSSAQRAVAPPSEAITASSAPTVLEAARLPAVAEAPAPGDALVRAPLPAAAPVLDTYIEGINFNENGALAGFWIPPDPSGAAGPNHLVSVVNVSIEWFTKDGVNQQSESLENF